MNCPECEKMAAVQKESRELSNFVDWLREQGYEICEENESENRPYDRLRKSNEQLFADYFGIDLKKVEEERRALLEEIRRK